MENVSLVDQFVPGHILYQFRKAPEVTSLQVLGVSLQMAANLEAMHKTCVLHNDFHSSNVLITIQPPGRPKRLVRSLNLNLNFLFKVQ
jgi:serine/threonine protein kinase